MNPLSLVPELFNTLSVLVGFKCIEAGSGSALFFLDSSDLAYQDIPYTSDE